MPTVVIGTAGHIDHGKTSLLRALTGIDADRLPEERARGLTIDVGYAHLAFADGVELDFVDVPGHDRLIGNMLVGAGEIDAALLVVAADDGPRPQTIEHLQLLDALGIADGLAVVTKADLVDEARAAAVAAEVRALLAPTSLGRARVLSASVATGLGLDAVRAELRTVRDAVVERWGSEGARGVERPVRLAVDRAFSVKGRGTVVTGTLRDGTVRPGNVLRREPGGESVRVREVQVHGGGRPLSDGGRTALNIAGLPADAVRRGDLLTAGPRVRGTERLLVELRPSAAVRPRGALRLHIGTDQVDVRVRRVPGGDGEIAILDLDHPTATFAGDRGVVREPGRGEVVGGVRILETSPPRGVSRRRLTRDRLATVVRAVADGRAEPIEAALLDLHGAGVRQADAGHRGLGLASDVRQALAAGAIELVTSHHADEPLSPGLPLPRARAALLRRLRSLVTIERQSADLASAAVTEVLDNLVAEGRLARRGDTLSDPARSDEASAPLAAAMARLEATLSVPAPPPLAEAALAAGCPPEGIRALQAEGRIVRLGPDLAWSTRTYHRLAAAALEQARERPLTPAAFRDATGTSRKFVLAILEDLDRRGILERTPAGHAPGPRAPGPAVESGA